MSVVFKNQKKIKKFINSHTKYSQNHFTKCPIMPTSTRPMKNSWFP